ncbi:uncharacterized protein VTP21DRAFT_1528 [Calcarisporiella thermophila]|uniref:uncharacterized protein n=1 Tax=Calcarisporiella thermophila TaxID=911321 RepID=UPI00374477EE
MPAWLPLESSVVWIDTKETTLRPTKEEGKRQARTAIRLCSTGSTTSKQLATFLGESNAACPEIMLGRQFSRSLMMAHIRALKTNPDWV